MKRKKYVVEVDQDFLDGLKSLSEKIGIEAFIAMMRRGVDKGRKEIICDAIERGLFTDEEYNAKFKDKYNDEYDYDGFSQYIGTVLHVMDAGDSDAVFVSLNDNLLRDRDMLVERFGVKILHVKEIGDENEV